MAKSKNITAKQIWGLVTQQEHRCAISGRELTPETASLDHIVPFSRGGEHSINNVWVVDQKVNIAKGTMTLEEFVSMCRDVIDQQDNTVTTEAAMGGKPEQTDLSVTVPPPGTLF